MSKEQNMARGQKMGLVIAIGAVLICGLFIFETLCKDIVFDKAPLMANKAFGIERLRPCVNIIKPGEHGYRTILNSNDAIGMFYPLKFRVTPCEDKSDNMYLIINFYTEDLETEEIKSVRVIMRSPTRYYVEGDDCEYEAYADNPDWMTLWENAEIPEIFRTSPPAP